MIGSAREAVWILKDRNNSNSNGFKLLIWAEFYHYDYMDHDYYIYIIIYKKTKSEILIKSIVLTRLDMIFNFYSDLAI